MQFILSERFSLEKMWKNRPFFRADMAGLGKYCTDGYGRIKVYRVKGTSLLGFAGLCVI